MSRIRKKPIKNVWLWIVFFIVIMVAYSWLGGMRSVAYTDTMQGIALPFGVFMLLLGSIIYFGGPATAAEYMQANAPDKLVPPARPDLVHWFGLLLLVGIGAAIYPHAFQRIFAAKSERTLKRSFARMAYMPFLTAGVVFTVGIIGTAAFPGLTTGDSEQLVGRMASVIASKNALLQAWRRSGCSAVCGAFCSISPSAWAAAS